MSEANGSPTLPLDELASAMCLGKMLDKNKNRGTLQPYLRNINVRWLSFDRSDMKEMRFEPGEESKTALADCDLDEAYVSQHVGLVRPVDCSVTRYIHIWITCPTHGRRELERLAYGAGKPGINLDNVRELNLALPPVDQQRQIKTECDRLLSICSVGESQIATNLKRAARLRQSILKRAFEGKLVPQDPTDEPAEELLKRIRTSKDLQINKRGNP